MMEAWMTLRPGSSFEIPQIRPNESAAQFPLATGKSKKLYESAAARAFVYARDLGSWKKTGREEVALHYFVRLLRRA